MICETELIRRSKVQPVCPSQSISAKLPQRTQLCNILWILVKSVLLLWSFTIYVFENTDSLVQKKCNFFVNTSKSNLFLATCHFFHFIIIWIGEDWLTARSVWLGLKYRPRINQRTFGEVFGDYLCRIFPPKYWKGIWAVPIMTMKSLK